MWASTSPRFAERVRQVLRSRRPQADRGFLLMEAIIAITIVTIVMSALTALLVTVTRVTDHQRDNQVAARIAVASLDRVRAVGAAGAVSGRDLSSATAQFTWSPASAAHPATSSGVAPWLATMAVASDSASAAGSGSGAAVPTAAVAQQINGRTFWISYFVGYCWRDAGTADGDCGKTQADGAIQYVRVVVAVSWTGGSCDVDFCDYVSAILLDGTGDPVFNFNQAAPSVPALVSVPNQSGLLGQPVQGVQGVSGCSSPCAVSASGGAPPDIFSATGLPPGLSMDTSGLVTGTPSAKGRFAVTVSVTDAFLDTASETFVWSVVDSLLIFDAPAAQSGTAGDSVNLAMTGASGGFGPPYTWSISGQPAGLSINAGTGAVTGTLVNAGMSATNYQTTVTLTDSSGSNTIAHTFGWTVAPGLAIYAPTTVPGTSVGGTVTGVQASYTCPNAPCSFSTSGLPGGITLSSITGTTSGTITLSGKVTGSAQTYAVKLTATDAKGAKASATFSWPVVAAPSITNPGNRSTSNSRSSRDYTLNLSSTCPLGGCSFSATATRSGGTSVSNVTVDSNGTVTVSGPSRTTYTITVTIIDADLSSTFQTFNWTFS